MKNQFNNTLIYFIEKFAVQPYALTAWIGLENTTLALQRAGFWQERLLGL